MLVLTRRIGEELVIGDGIRVVVVSCHGKKVRLGVAAPPAVPVNRKEVAERLLQEKQGQEVPPTTLVKRATKKG
jgi:carbon storage regulator